MKIIPISTSILMRSSDVKIKKSHHKQCEHKVSYNPHYYMPRDLNKKYSNAISFEGVTGKGVVKQRGMLMHITSLPGTRSYCGQFGDIQTKKFIDFLSASKQTHWIMNPLNSLQSDLCPYNSNGRFSRNKFIVNLNRLTEKAYGNLLKLSELPEDVSSPVFTLDMLEKQKNPRFEIAHKRFQKLPSDAPIKKEYNEFLKTNDKLWLNEYANYDVISKIHGNDWHSWNKDLQTAPEIARNKNSDLSEVVFQILNQENKITHEEFLDKISLYKFEQFLYEKQFNEMTNELKEKNIKLILDLPIGVSASSIDTWGKKNIFILDNNYNPTYISGCPPEKTYNYTQTWGHALYNYDSPEFWQYQEDSLRQLLKTADLRLDHFVGYVNRAAIPTEYKKADGTILRGDEIFKPKEQGGMGSNFFKADWIENIDNKRSPKGENAFELFIRVAEELGKKPEDTYILESFGPLTKTKAYKNFDKKYGTDFITQKVPIAMGIGETDKKLQQINVIQDSSRQENVAYLTGNHDMPSLRQNIDYFLGYGLNNEKTDKKTKERFLKFCKVELNLSDEEIKDPKVVFDNAMKWHYTQNVKQVQTTLQDALGIYWRPNIPGHWNGMYDKYLQKPTSEGLLPYWSYVFPKDFLDRENPSGINPGYKNFAESFIKMMEELYNSETV